MGLELLWRGAGFERELHAVGGDLPAFYRRVRELAKMPQKARDDLVCQLGAGSQREAGSQRGAGGSETTKTTVVSLLPAPR